MSKITYNDKVKINELTDVPAINKVTDGDMNEIKQVVNTNDDNVGDIANLETDDTTSVVSAINEINEKLLSVFFKSGDTLTLGNDYINAMGGYATGSTKNLTFTIVSPKSLKNVNTITINALRVRVRSVTGTYLLTSGSTSSYADVINNVDNQGNALAQTCESYTATKVTDNLIRFSLLFNNAIYTTNNTPMAVEYRNLELTFN